MLALFFFDTFPYTLRECVLSKLDITTRTCCEKQRQMCLLGESRSPQCPGLGNHLMATPKTQIRGPKMVSEQGEGQWGEESHWPLAIQLCWHPSFGRGGDEHIAWSHFCWLIGPQVTLPSAVAVTGWKQGEGPEVLGNKNHRGTRKSCGCQTQPGPQTNLANRYAETLSTEAPQGTATQMLSSNTHVKGHGGCCFRNYQSNYYSPSD